MIWFTMMNILNFYLTITMSLKRQSEVDDSIRHKNSYILKFQIGKEHLCPQYENFEIVSSGFRNNNKKRKLSEALRINTMKPSLNMPERSIPLELFI